MNPGFGRGFFMRTRNVTAIFILCCLLCALVYSFGLPGGFMFDDYPNLESVKLFTEGKLSGPGVIFTNGSGTFGRSIPMASFVANAATTGMNAGPMKVTNIGIHLLCGCLIAVLLCLLLKRDKTLLAREAAYACGIAAVWLLLPINASTTLYIVQRMTQLSAVFVLAGLVAYVSARLNWHTLPKRSIFLMWVAVPTCTLLALLSKENGALLPLLALVIEYTLFNEYHFALERRHIHAFFGITLVLPILAGLLALIFGHGGERLDYSNRSFTLGQRLLTEPSVLWDYVRNILIPFGSGLGLTHDDYPVSTTFFSMRPILAIFGWIAAVYLAWRMHRIGYQLVLTGILFFLAGHAMESTIFPLEIYFEHRNYLPEVGILLAVFGLISSLLQRLPSPSANFRPTLAILVIVLLASYAGATAVRASTWQDMDTLMRASILAHPNSPRLNFQFAGLLSTERQFDQALDYMDRAAALTPEDRSALLLAKITIYCEQGSEVPKMLIDEIKRSPPKRFLIPGDLAYEAMTKLVGADKCRSFGPIDAAEIGAAWVQHDHLAKSFSTSWRFQHYTALNYSRSKQPAVAIPYSEAAWQLSGHQLQTGLLLFQLYDAVGNKVACESLLVQLMKYDDGTDIESHEAIKYFSSYLNAIKKLN